MPTKQCFVAGAQTVSVMAFFPPATKLTAARAKEIILLLRETAQLLETPTNMPMPRARAAVSLKPVAEAPLVEQQAPTAEAKPQPAGLKARVRAIVKSEAPAMSTPPECPDCGGPMQQRRRRSDGQKFWGCKAYPDCTGSRDSYVSQARRNAHLVDVDEGMNEDMGEPF